MISKKGYFRSLLIPVFCYLYLSAQTTGDYLPAAVVKMLILLAMAVMSFTLISYIQVFRKMKREETENRKEKCEETEK